jgi:hypothetical protein
MFALIDEPIELARATSSRRTHDLPRGEQAIRLMLEIADQMLTNYLIQVVIR